MSRTKTEKPAGRSSAENESTLQRVQRLIHQGNYNAALESAFHPGPDLQMRNAKGVCLLRLGRAQEAITLYREMLYKSGCSWIRPELPTIYKLNFATALLLAANPSGCAEILRETMDESHPGVQRLRACIRQWKLSLTFWQRLNWMCGWTSEENSHIPLDFEPGLLEDGVIAELPANSQTGHFTSPD